MAAVPPYGVVIRDAVATGDLARMKRAAAEAEEYLRDYGNVAAALENLKIEIAKLEARHGRAG